jgi:hypothetical protein
MAGGGGGGGSGGIYLNGGKELASVTTWSQFHLHLAVSQAENKQKYLDLKEADFIASFQHPADRSYQSIHVHHG